VDHDVVAVASVLCALQGAVPREDERAPLHGLAQDDLVLVDDAPARVEDAATEVACNDRGRIHEDGLDLGEQVVVATEQHDAAGTRDRHPHLVVELEAVAPLEVLLGQEDLDELPQAVLLVRVEQLVGGDVVLEDLGPGGRELLLEDLVAAATGEPAEDHEESYSDSAREANAPAVELAVATVS